MIKEQIIEIVRLASVDNCPDDTWNENNEECFNPTVVGCNKCYTKAILAIPDLAALLDLLEQTKDKDGNYNPWRIRVMAEDQELPDIPEFTYDSTFKRTWLKRGAINYSKLLTNFVKVLEVKG